MFRGKGLGIVSFTAIGALIFFAVLAIPCHSQVIEPNQISQLEYRYIGPPGNRITSVVGIPGDYKTYYIGAASGGIWKTSDSGASWAPIFDEQPVQSIGSLAVASSDPNIVWAGTGETFLRSNISIGNGVYKSSDAGKTWKHMGLDEAGRIGRVVIHPRDPNTVYAAVLGHSYGPQEERGVYRTTDGGNTWDKVLFVNKDTGCADIAMNPDDPKVLLAGMWPIVIHTWGRFSGGEGGGLYMSKDGGDTWTQLEGHGLPETPMGKIGLAFAPGNSKRIYALIETGDGSLWRSDDGGENWKLTSYSHSLNERPHYYSRIAASPDNDNEAYTLSINFGVTRDGGETFELEFFGHDYHDMWIDPVDGDRMIVGDDNHVFISVNRGETWLNTKLPIAQMYHVAVNNRIPYNVYGNRQDGPSYRGPSNSLVVGWDLSQGSINSGQWETTAGCESGFAIPDPVDSDIVWGGCYNAGLDRINMKTGHKQSVRVWPESPMGSPAGDLKYRFNWTFPIAISPHDHNKVYVGSQHVHMTTNGGQSWDVISPDLSTGDPEMLQGSGGITADNLGVEYGCLVFAIAESPLEEGLIWAGTNDGLVQVTRDGGANWKNVTGNIPDLPPLGTVSNIEPSRYDAGTAYITVDLHQVNHRDPFIYKTEDYGETWKSISGDIPRSVFSYAHCVREDPSRKGMLYAGTENALYVSLDDGGHWTPLQTNLPHAPIHWMAVQEHFNDLVVATYGRGFWVLDDVTPLQRLTPEVLQTDQYLFEPRPAYRFRNVNRSEPCPVDHCQGKNPPYGASLHYFLKSKEEVKVTVLDEGGRTVRALEAAGEPGVNRLWWDLRYEAPDSAKLRNKPPGHPHVKLNEEGWRPLISWGVHGGLVGPVVAPGTYKVKLNVGGAELVQNLVVKKDPNSEGTLSDIEAQVKTLVEIRDNLDQVVDAIDEIEWVRRQIHDLTETEDLAASVKQAGKELDQKLTTIEEQFFQVRLAGGDEESYRVDEAPWLVYTVDAFRVPMKLYSKLSILAGDIGGSADFPPTTQQIKVHELLKKRLAGAQTELEQLLGNDLPAFNSLLRSNNLTEVKTGAP